MSKLGGKEREEPAALCRGCWGWAAAWRAPVPSFISWNAVVLVTDSNVFLNVQLVDFNPQSDTVVSHGMIYVPLVTVSWLGE